MDTPFMIYTNIPFDSKKSGEVCLLKRGIPMSKILINVNSTNSYKFNK